MRSYNAHDDENSERYYENKYPEQEELVMVKVNSMAEMGAYVSLLEYDNIEGMILFSELSRKRIRSISKLIQVGQTQVVVVLRVDTDKGYIDLSKRKVTQEDIEMCNERYNKSKAVHSIMRFCAEKSKKKLFQLNQEVTWRLLKKFKEKHSDEKTDNITHVYDIFKLVLTDEAKVFEGLNIDSELQKLLVANIKLRMKPQPVKVRADIEVSCISHHGIDAIKKALTAGEQLSKKKSSNNNTSSSDSDQINGEIKIKLIAPPLYVMTSTTYDKIEGIQQMNDCILEIKKVIETFHGSLSVKSKPHSASKLEDTALEKLINRLLRENELENEPEDGEGEGDE